VKRVEGGPPSRVVAAATTLAALGLAATVGSALAGDDPFAALASYNQPWFALPGWGWAVVGVVYYIAIAVVTYRLLRRLPDSRRAVGFVLAVIVANEAWNVLVFGLQALTVAAVGLGLFAILVAAAVRPVRRCDVGSGHILVAYLVWVVVYDLPWIVALAGANPS
jgi:tryptophan-rich sensory protein